MENEKNWLWRKKSLNCCLSTQSIKKCVFWLILIQFSSIWLIWFSFSIILFSKNYNIHYPTNLSKSWPAQKLEKWLEKACWLTPNPPHWCPPVRTGPTGLTWVPKHETAKWHSKTANCAKKIRNKTWPRALITPDPGKTDKQIWPIFGLWKTRPVQPPLGGGVLECRKMHKKCEFRKQKRNSPSPPLRTDSMSEGNHTRRWAGGAESRRSNAKSSSPFSHALGEKGDMRALPRHHLTVWKIPHSTCDTQQTSEMHPVLFATLCTRILFSKALNLTALVLCRFLHIFYDSFMVLVDPDPLKSGKSIGGPTSTSGHIREIKTEWM